MVRTRTRGMLDKIVRVMKDIENTKNTLYNTYDEIIDYERRINTSREQAELGRYVASNTRRIERLSNAISDLHTLIRIEISPCLRDSESELRQLERDYNNEHDEELRKRT